MGLTLLGTINHHRAAQHCERSRLPLARKRPHRFSFNQDRVRLSRMSPGAVGWEQKGFLLLNLLPLCQDWNVGLCLSSACK